MSISKESKPLFRTVGNRKTGGSGMPAGLFALFLTAAVLAVSFFLRGVYPFGTGTLSWCDMNQQVIPLMCDLKDILNGKAGFFLNMKNASGMDFYGVFFFFLSSPFSFLVKFTAKADIPYLMNTLIAVKLCLSALLAGSVFQKLFPSNRFAVNGVLGVAYALCGYGMLFYQNIMWLDVMLLFPLVVWGCYRLLVSGKAALLIFSLIGCVLLNFYISFMIYLFVVFFFGAYTLAYRQKPGALYVKLAFSGFLSLAVSAAVLVPCFIQYSSSGRRSDLITGLAEASFFTSWETTLVVLLCTGLIPAAVFYLTAHLSGADKKAKFLLLVFFLLTVPLVVDPVNMMWHTGSYMSFPARYGFMTVFAGLCVAGYGFTKLRFPAQGRVGATVAAFVFTFTASAFILFFESAREGDLSAYTNTLWNDSDGFEGLVLICLAVAAACGLLWVLVKRDGIPRRVFAFLLCVVVGAQGLCSANLFMGTAVGKFDLKNYRQFLETAEFLPDDGFYRVNLDRKSIDANMTGAAGLNSISHYTSLNQTDTMKAARTLGYSGYWMETGNWGGSILSDALLSVGYTVRKDAAGYKAEKNPYYMALGIRTASAVPALADDRNRLTAAQTLFGQVTGVTDTVSVYEPDAFEYCSLREEDGRFRINRFSAGATISYQVAVTQTQHLYFDCYDGFSNNLTELINNSFQIRVNGVLCQSGYPGQHRNGLVDLGEHTAATVTITLEVLKDVECSSFGVYGVDCDKVLQASESVCTLGLAEKSGGLAGTASQPGQYFISIPYSENYKITLNGEPVSYRKAFGGYLSVELDSVGQVEISSRPAGLTAGIIISVLGVLLLIAFLIFGNRLAENHVILQTVSYGAFIGGSGALFVVVYIIPTLLNLIHACL